MAEILSIHEMKLRQQMDLTLLLENERAKLRMLTEDAAFYKGFAEQQGGAAIILRDMCWDIEDEAHLLHDRVNDALTVGPVEQALLDESRQTRADLEARLLRIREAINRKK